MATRCTTRIMLPVLILAAWSLPSAFGCVRACDRYEYCDENSNTCINCSLLCDKDEYSCFHKCQNFLFKSYGQDISTLKQNLSIASTILWVLGILLVCCLGVAITLLIRKYYPNIKEKVCWRPQNKNTTPVGYTHENPNTKSPKVAPKNGANVARQTSTTVSIYPETDADNSVQTGTTSISHRHPAEDSTESYSYDNAACNVTPTSNNPMPKF
ncbi:uncharacterized protein LOC128715050 [Anopheles marshallii]|uniref:uncharacterized protein LOC128715050 n=1 Tax=Anopheles marshallii TaxID=1521116 RepID=UPI00237BADB6|nr:uncharacterized protein LOC128715050 [Anopheles marshallii]